MKTRNGMTKISLHNTYTRKNKISSYDKFQDVTMDRKKNGETSSY